MPTENRSSNTEMVSVPRDVAENAWQALDDDGRFEESCPLREALDRPPQLRQGEPVALPARKSYEESFSVHGQGQIMGWNACLDEIAKLGPLYTRPAQGEPVAWEMDDTAGESGKILVTNDTRVRDEWVRNELPVAPLFGRADPGEVELAGWKDRCRRLNDESMAWMRDNDTLRAQLAERDALPPVAGDLLPPVGSKVLIHLAREDEWVEHTVVGYYAWENLRPDPSVHRVFVRVRDAYGYLNARGLGDIRPVGLERQP